MPRVNRWLEQNAVFHVLNRGVERRDIFNDEKDRLRFLDILEDLHQSFSCQTLAYCLMGNHFHLVIRDQKCQLSKALAYLGNRYVRRFNLRHLRDGPLFRGRFKSIRILTDEQLKATIEYVHMNPIKDGFIAEALEWEWSSFKYYQRLESFPKWMADGFSSNSRFLEPRKYRCRETDLIQLR